ncbi:MAG: DMT family transporter [Planctomycetota bacterium]
MTSPANDQHAQSISALGLVAMLTTLFAWTASPLLNRFFAEYIDVWNLNGWRYAMAALCWLPLILWRLTSRTMPAGVWKAALLPAVFNSVGQVAFAYSFYFTDATTVAFALRVQLIAVAVGGAVFFAGERRVIRDPRFLGGMILVAIGVSGYLLLAPDAPASDAPSGDNTALGFALGAIAGAVFGFYALAVRPMMKTTGPMLSYAVISLYTAVAMVALMLTLSPGHGSEAVTDLTPKLFGLLVVSAVVSLVIGHPCYYTAIRALGVSATAAVLQLQPISVGVASIAMFTLTANASFETPTNLWQWCAGLVAIASAIFMLRVQHRLAKRDRAHAHARAHDPPGAPAQQDFEEDHTPVETADVR